MILAAHSLGCLVVAWWAELSLVSHGTPVAGALLVAPADVDRAEAPAELRSFAPSPRSPLPFPSLLVSSSDDPWISPREARNLAAAWGSDLVDLGPLGHINAESELGLWLEGQELLDRLVDARAGRGPCRPRSGTRMMPKRESVGGPSIGKTST